MVEIYMIIKIPPNLGNALSGTRRRKGCDDPLEKQVAGVK
jgi:hypothetical protein